MIEGNSGIFCLSDGTWSPSGRCVEIPTTVASRCGSLPPMSHGGFSSGFDYIGSVRTLTCDLGYEINGGDEITCRDNGQWSSPGRCVEIPTCANVPAVENGHIAPGPSTIGSSRGIICNAGYLPTGNSQIIFLQNGNWSDPEPCVEG